MSAALTDKIEAAKARAKAAAELIAAQQEKIKAEEAKIAELERQAAEPPKRNHNRTVTEIREVMLLEAKMRERYGVGYSGLAEIVRKAKKDGIEPVVATGQATPLPQQNEGWQPGPPTATGEATVTMSGTVEDSTFPDDGHGGALAASLVPEEKGPYADEIAGAIDDLVAKGVLEAIPADEGPEGEPIWDDNDEPPVDNPPEAINVPQVHAPDPDDDDVPW